MAVCLKCRGCNATVVLLLAFVVIQVTIPCISGESIPADKLGRIVCFDVIAHALRNGAMVT